MLGGISLKPSLLPFLACIKCKGQLSLLETETRYVSGREAYEIVSGVLTCKECVARFPIRGGVPRLVDKELSSNVDLNTGERFAESWREFSRLHEKHKQQFFDWIFPVNEDFLDDKLILEAGVGTGCHAQIVAQCGAKLVFGIDIGDAIDVAYANVGHLANIHLVQADIRNLPFNKVFDFAYSVSGLHHMQDPQAGFNSVVNCLRPNGSVCIWVYGKENNWWITNLVSPLRKIFTSNLSTEVLKAISTMLSILVYLISKIIVRIYAKLQSQANWLPELFYQTYLNYISHFDFQEINHIVFDHLTAPVAYYIPRRDVFRWFFQAGFEKPIVRWHNKNSWMGFASNRQWDLDLMSRRMQQASTAKLRQAGDQSRILSLIP